MDGVLNGQNETLKEQVKFELLKASLSGPGGNTTGADGLTMQKANATSNVDAASVLMEPLDFYQVKISLITSILHQHLEVLRLFELR